MGDCKMRIGYCNKRAKSRERYGADRAMSRDARVYATRSDEIGVTGEVS